jgi:ubiquinone/menaquinone biosynthesis C-methylase UbiE
MRLWQVRRHWNLFARRDPFWAVLTTPGTEGNRWAIDEFFARGQREVDAAITTIQARLPGAGRRQALDFGCGVGRITQALAQHFDRVTGVDISSDMLVHARRHNRHGDRVAYEHNPVAHLGRFADGTFDLVFSVLTLQHLAPEYSRRYLAEFMRVCAPHGAVYFQMTGRPVRPPRRSWYPPTVAKNAWRRINALLALHPAMEMHSLSRAEVEALIRTAGGEIVWVDESHGAGQDYESCVYLARRV